MTDFMEMYPDQEMIQSADGMEMPPEEPSVEELERQTDAYLVQIFNEDIESCRMKQRQLAPDRVAAYGYYRGTLPEPAHGDIRSKIVSKDVSATVEWKMPSFMRFFTSTGRICQAMPVGLDDNDRSEAASLLLNYQFFKGNRGFLKLYKVIKLSEIYGNGYTKSVWLDRVQESPVKFVQLTEGEFNEIINDEQFEIVSFQKEETVDESGMATVLYTNVIGKQSVVVYRGPAFDIVENEDLFIDPAAKDVESANYVIERYWLTYSECLDMEDVGIFKNTDLLKNKIQAGTRVSDDEAQMEKMERSTQINIVDDSIYTMSTVQLGRKPVECYEYWGNVDIGQDGRTVPWMFVVSNGVVLRSEPNPYNHGRPPYDEFRVNIDPHSQIGISAVDMIKPFQDAKTAMFRQMLDNMSFQNNQMWEVDRSVQPDYRALLNPRPGGVVRVNRNNGIRALTPPALSGHVMQVFEFMQTILESLTGQTRYNQGLDASSLNKTASGITQIMERSDQRNWLEAMLLAEIGLKPMMEKWLSMNQQYMDKGYVVRLLNRSLEVNPDDIQGIFDLEIVVGESMAMVQSMIQQMLQMFQMAPQLIQAGVMTPDDFYNLYVDIVKKWGFRDFERYSTDPKFVESMKKQAQELQVVIQALVESGVISPDQIKQVVAQWQASKQQLPNGGQGGTQDAGSGNPETAGVDMAGGNSEGAIPKTAA